MEIKLYTYNGKDNETKKVSEFTGRYSGNITTYNVVDPLNMWFELSNLYDCNYAKYEYNNKTYYAFVEVSTTAKGLYRYSCRVDSLTTAWYAGCMDTNAICMYSNQGNADVMDTRATKAQTLQRIISQQQSSISIYDTNFVISVANYDPLNYSTLSATNTLGVNSYLIDFDNFRQVMNEIYNGWGPTSQSKFVPGIMGIYQLKRYEPIQDLSYSIDTKIRLHTINYRGYSPKDGSVETAEIDLKEGHPALLVNLGAIENKQPGGTFMYDLDQPIVYTPNIGEGYFVYHIPDTGDIKFNILSIIDVPHMYNGKVTIVSIGYRYRYDFIGGTKRVHLVIGYKDSTGQTVTKDYDEYYIEAPIKTTVPVAYDTTLTDWRQLKNSLISSAIASVGSIIGAIATAGITAPLAFSAVSETVNNANQIMSTEYRESQGGYSQVGASGGSAEQLELPTVYFYYNEYHNLTDIQTLFGKPDGKSRLLSGVSSGYCKTDSCKLITKGYPDIIIAEAENICNSGFYIS